MVWYQDQSAVVPAQVGALIRPGEPVTTLLAGDEARGASLVVRHLRQVGYRWQEERVTDALLLALFARVRHDFTGEQELRLALPFWVQEQAGRIEAAAREAGWEAVTLLTDVAVLAAAAISRAEGHSLLAAVVPGSDLVDLGVWERGETGWQPVAWERLLPDEALTALRRHISRHTGGLLVVGGDGAPDWLRESGAVISGSGMTLLNLGEDGVAKAAASATLPLASTVTHPALYLESRNKLIPLGQPSAAGAPVWRALAGEGGPVYLRCLAGWGREQTPATPLCDLFVPTGLDPVLVGVEWSGGEGWLTVLGPDGGERLRHRFSMRFS